MTIQGKARKWHLALVDWRYRQARRPPGLKATHEVGGPLEPEPAERGGGEARLVALVAHHDHLPGGIGRPLIAGIRKGVAAPLEHVAGDEEGAGHHAVALARDSARMSTRTAPEPRAERASAGSRRRSWARASASRSSTVLGDIARGLYAAPNLAGQASTMPLAWLPSRKPPSRRTDVLNRPSGGRSWLPMRSRTSGAACSTWAPRWCLTSRSPR